MTDQRFVADLNSLESRRRASGRTFAQAKAAASPRERKVWALWHQLHREHLLDHSNL